MVSPRMCSMLRSRIFCLLWFVVVLIEILPLKVSSLNSIITLEQLPFDPYTKVFDCVKRAPPFSPPIRDSDIPDEILKVWYTNETFDMLTLRWGSQGSPELFALFNWRDPATKDDGGSRLYVSHDYGVTFSNVTDKLRCATQSKSTSLSSIYWTEATTKTIMVTDISNRCLHVSRDAGYSYKSIPLTFVPSRLEIHSRFDNVVVAHDVDSKPEASHNPKGVWISFNFGEDWQNVDDIVAGWRLGVEEFDPKANCSGCVRIWVFREEAETPHLKVLVYEYTKDGRTAQQPVVKKERVNEFEIKGPFMFAVNYDNNKRKRTLLVSFRGSPFVAANFGNLTREVVDYHIAHVSQSQAYVTLTFDNNESDLFMSGHGDGNFTRSLANVYFVHPKIGKLPLHNSGVIKASFHKIQALVDMHAVDGLEGVLFANEVRRRPRSRASSSPAADDDFEEYLVTKMSEDGGSSWHLINAPARSVLGEQLNCTEKHNNCSLQLSLRFTLHSHTRDPPTMWSSRNAPGLLLAVGNWGSELSEIGNRSLFRSIDGGVTWEHSLYGQHMFSVANRGGLIAAVNDAGPTRNVLYSWTYGSTWSKLFLPTAGPVMPNTTTTPQPTTTNATTGGAFANASALVQHIYAAAAASQRLNIIQILSEPGTNTTVFNVYATPSDIMSTGRAAARPAWIVYRIDLKAIFLGRRCTKADFAKWSFEDDHDHVNCLLGRKTVYYRRDARAKCLIDTAVQVVPSPNVTSCECTVEDYECDVGFSTTRESKHMCLPDGATSFFPANCPENSTFLFTHGYRKRPFDSCTGGIEEGMQPVAVPCPDPEHYYHMLNHSSNAAGDTTRSGTSINVDGGAPGSRHCPTQTFDCGQGMCIPRYWVCDGESDCTDGSDERDCHLMTCLQGEFTCNKTHRCIPEAWKCDAHPDCGADDLSDEQNCTALACSANNFQCTHKPQCIPAEYVCDREPDCTDGSDEQQNCTYSGWLSSSTNEGVSRERCADTHTFYCNGTCIPARWQCDGEEDCLDGSDERNCTGQCRQFVCKNGNCVRSEFVCDGTNNCGDNSDEEVSCKKFANYSSVQPFDPSSKSSSVDAAGGVAIPWQFEEGNDRPDASEESRVGSGIDNYFHNVRCTVDMPHKCKGKPGHADYCIPRKWVCDGTADCIDASDEQNCGTSLLQKPTKKFKFDQMGVQVSKNDAGGATVASGAAGLHTTNDRHPIGSSLVVCLLFIIAIAGVSMGVLYKQGRLAILQRRGFAFRRFQNASDVDGAEPTIAMTGSRRTSGPYAHPREAISDEGFVDESLGNFDIMPHSSSNRLHYNYHSSTNDDGGLESVTLGIDEQPMFVHFSDGDPLVGDPPTSPSSVDAGSTVTFMPSKSNKLSSNLPPPPSSTGRQQQSSRNTTSGSTNTNKTPPKST